MSASAQKQEGSLRLARQVTGGPSSHRIECEESPNSVRLRTGLVYVCTSGSGLRKVYVTGLRHFTDFSGLNTPVRLGYMSLQVICFTVVEVTEVMRFLRHLKAVQIGEGS